MRTEWWSGRVRQDDFARVVAAVCTDRACGFGARRSGRDADGLGQRALLRDASKHTLDTGHETVFTVERETRFVRHRADRVCPRGSRGNRAAQRERRHAREASLTTGATA